MTLQSIYVSVIVGIINFAVHLVEILTRAKGTWTCWYFISDLFDKAWRKSGIIKYTLRRSLH